MPARLVAVAIAALTLPLANDVVAEAPSGRSWGVPLTGLAVAALAAVALGLAWSRRPGEERWRRRSRLPSCSARS